MSGMGWGVGGVGECSFPATITHSCASKYKLAAWHYISTLPTVGTLNLEGTWYPGWVYAGFVWKPDLSSHQCGCLTPCVLIQAPLLFGWHNRCRDVVTVCPHLFICHSPVSGSRAGLRLGNTFNRTGWRNLLGLNQNCRLKPGDIRGHVADMKQMVLSTYDQLIDHVIRHPQTKDIYNDENQRSLNYQILKKKTQKTLVH